MSAISPISSISPYSKIGMPSSMQQPISPVQGEQDYEALLNSTPQGNSSSYRMTTERHFANFDEDAFNQMSESDQWACFNKAFTDNIIQQGNRRSSAFREQMKEIYNDMEAPPKKKS